MKKRILVVEADSAIATSVGKVLVEGGFEVAVVRDAEQALATHEEGEFDLLLLDLNLSIYPSWDTFECLTDRYPSIPVIIMTGLPNQCSLALGKGVGAVLEKPIDGAVLIETIGVLMNTPKETGGSSGGTTRFIPSSTQLLKELREKAITPFRFVQPGHVLGTPRGTGS